MWKNLRGGLQGSAKSLFFWHEVAPLGLLFTATWATLILCHRSVFNRRTSCYISPLHCSQANGAGTFWSRSDQGQSQSGSLTPTKRGITESQNYRITGTPFSWLPSLIFLSLWLHRQMQSSSWKPWEMLKSWMDSWRRTNMQILNSQGSCGPIWLSTRWWQRGEEKSAPTGLAVGLRERNDGDLPYGAWVRAVEQFRINPFSLSSCNTTWLCDPSLIELPWQLPSRAANQEFCFCFHPETQPPLQLWRGTSPNPSCRCLWTITSSPPSQPCW